MKIMFAIALLPLLSNAALADGRDLAPKVSKRQQRQQAHIAQGVRAGELTPAEAATLRDQQRAIELRRRNMEADGKLSKTERKLLRYEQQSARNGIQRERNDEDKLHRGDGKDAPR